MNYESTELRSSAEFLYKTAPIFWPLFILGGISAGFTIPFTFSSILGDLAFPIASTLAVIGIFIGYALSIVTVSFLRIHALQALRLDNIDRSANRPIEETSRISLTS